MLAFKRSEIRKLVLLAAVILSVACLTGCAVNPAQVIGEVQAIVSGILAILAVVGPLLPSGEAAAIASLVPLISNGLKALKKVVDDYHTSPGEDMLAKVQEAFADVQRNLAQLEAASKVSHPETQRKLLAIVTVATQALASLESSIHYKHPAAVAAAQAAQTQ